MDIVHQKSNFDFVKVEGHGEAVLHEGKCIGICLVSCVYPYRVSFFSWDTMKMYHGMNAEEAVGNGFPISDGGN